MLLNNNCSYIEANCSKTKLPNECVTTEGVKRLVSPPLNQWVTASRDFALSGGHGGVEDTAWKTDDVQIKAGQKFRLVNKGSYLKFVLTPVQWEIKE